MANQVDFKILPSDQFNVYSPQTRSEKVITYFTLLSKLRGDILAVSSQDDPNSIVSAYYTNVGNTQTLHLVKADGSEVTASNDYAGTVTSVGVSMPSAFTVTNSPITTSGTIQITGAGTTAQYVRGDGTLATFPSLTGFVPYVGATQNVDLGEYQIKAGQVAFDLTPTGTAGVGIMRWNDQDGTLDLGLLGGNVTLQIGQEQVVRVVNKSGINLTEAGYQAVKITGAQGNRLKVGLAQANNDANSADTIGLVTENIALNEEGFITSFGLVRNIDTTGALQGETWADGDVIYLSPTTAGAVTKVKPVAPQHTVILGFVVRAHQTQGQIYVKVDNGYELEELHDVAPTPYVNNGVLYRDTATNLWKSATIPTVLGYTPANSATTISTTAPLSGGGDLSANRTLSISQSGASTDGYLSSTDWNTFNSKQGALTFTAPLVNTGGTVTITQAGASANGYLSSTDWNTFNNKASDAFKTIAVTGQSNIVADSPTDTLTFEAGSNIVITTDAANDKITITAIGGGSGSVTSVDMSVPTGFSISGNPITTSGTLALAFASGYSLPTNASQANWNTAYNDSITAFSYNTSTGVLTLTQQDAGTLTATVTLQPFTTDNLTQGSTNLYDKVVSLTGAGTTVVTGTYPNFTITSNDQHVGTVTSIATSAPITGGTITTSGTIGITQSGASSDGYLSSTDWNTFNGKAGSSFTTIAVAGQSDIVADSASDTLTVASGTGISLATNATSDTLTITNSAPDQVVAITASTAIAVTGTYPNFTIENTAPDQVVAVTAGTGISVTGTYPNFTITNTSPSSGGTITGGGTTNYLSKWTGASALGDSLVFDNGTNVGIGTASPSQKLHVVGNGLYTGNLDVGHGVSTADAAINLGTGRTGNGFAYIDLIGDTTYTDYGLRILRNNGGANTTSLIVHRGTGDFSIQNNEAANLVFLTAATERMRVTADGNVGIGTTAPINKLDIVDGALRVVNSLAGGEILAKLLAYTPAPFGLVIRGENTGATTIQVQRESNNAEVFALSLQPNGGNVGIGTTSPGAKLDVNGGANTEMRLTTSGSGILQIGQFTNGAYIGTTSSDATAGALRFGTNGAERMRVDINGNLGIGTNSPATKLEVYGGHVDSKFRIYSIGNGGVLDASLDMWASEPGVTFDGSGIGNNVNGHPYYGRRNSSLPQSYLRFYDGMLLFSTGSTTASESMRITSAGNVGIGTTAPTAKLTIQGSASEIHIKNDTTNSLVGGGWDGTSQWIKSINLGVALTPLTFQASRFTFDNGNVGIGTTAPASKLNVAGGNVTVSAGYGIAWSGDQSRIMTPEDNVSGALIQYGSGAIMRFVNGTTEHVRINGSGNVGIGTTSPSTKLHVAGDGRFEGNVGIGHGSAAEYFLEIGQGRTGNGFAYIDLIGDATYTDYGLRIIRNNSGANTPSSINHRGLGTFSLNAEDAAPIAFLTSSSERMRITSDGNVGIGTTNPTRTLHVVGGDSGTGTHIAHFEGRFGVVGMYIRGDGNVGIGTTAPAASLQIASTNGVIFGATSGSVGTSQISTTSQGSPVSSRFAFGTDGTGWQFRIAKNTAGTIADLMTIVDNGNVGIGTTSPTEKLHVDGNAVLTYNNSYQGINSIGNKAILARVSPTTGIINYAEYATATNLNGFVMGSTATQLKGIFATNKLEFTTNSSTRMTITSGGLVGIGTTSPSHILHITDVMRMDNVSAYSPNLTSDSFAKHGYGDVSNDRYLAEPAIWFKINVDGTEYVIPGYTEVI